MVTKKIQYGPQIDSNGRSVVRHGGPETG